MLEQHHDSYHHAHNADPQQSVAVRLLASGKPGIRHGGFPYSRSQRPAEPNGANPLFLRTAEPAEHAEEENRPGIPDDPSPKRRRGVEHRSLALPARKERRIDESGRSGSNVTGPANAAAFVLSLLSAGLRSDAQCGCRGHLHITVDLPAGKISVNFGFRTVPIAWHAA